MTPLEHALQVAGLLSAEVVAAETEDDVARLGGLVAALALVEERTRLALGGRVSQAELDATVSDAREALGPGW